MGIRHIHFPVKLQLFARGAYIQNFMDYKETKYLYQITIKHQKKMN